MTALDPLSATRSLMAPEDEFTGLPWGDLTLEPAISPHPVQTGAFQQIPRNASDGASDLYTDADADPVGDWVIIYAVTGISNADPYWLVTDGPWLTLVVSATQIIYCAPTGEVVADAVDFATPPDSGLVLIAVSANATETRLVVSGEGTMGTGGPRSTVSAFPFNIRNTDDSTAVVGVWLWEETTATEADLQDTIDALWIQLTGEGSQEGAGDWSLSGQGTVSHEWPQAPEPGVPDSGGSQTPPEPPAWTVPVGVTNVLIPRVSEIMSAPNLDAWGNPQGWKPTQVIEDQAGHMQIVIEGQDITWVDGVRTPHPDWSRGEPFGSLGARIDLPWMHAFRPWPSWATRGANVEIILHPPGEEAEPVWLYTGVVFDLTVSEDSGAYGLDCQGILLVGDEQRRTPAFTTVPKDIGQLIPELVNGVVSRRTSDMAQVVTGIQTSVAGGWESVFTGFIQRLLSTALTEGRQWTVKCDHLTPELVLKDVTTVNWTVYTGQRGIDIDLVQSTRESVNVIYGEGINSQGGRWRNDKYPNWRPDDTPPYPFVNPATTIGVGTTDAMTDTGNGVSVWQAKAGRPVTGVFSQADRSALIELQRQAGITVDGSLGPQSWAATFDTGANTGTLDGAFIMPLALATEVQPRLWGPDGDDLGPNPDYNPDVIRVDRKYTFGQGVSFEEGQRAAREILARDLNPGWHGTIVFEGIDPNEGSRYLIREGHNILVKAWHGEDVLLHIAAIDVDEDRVSLDVDTHARDYPTLAAIKEAEREAEDPARLAQRRILEGEIATDRAIYDEESPAGRIPRHAVFSNLWDVRRIPMGAYGQVVRTEMRTSDPVRKFAMAVFGKAVTAAQLLDRVGNPLTADSNPWYQDLEDMGLLMAYGWAEQPAGYWPGVYSDPSGATGSELTGKLLDDASWEYVSDQSPWLWVAVIAQSACYVEGRLWGAPR